MRIKMCNCRVAGPFGPSRIAICTTWARCSGLRGVPCSICDLQLKQSVRVGAHPRQQESLPALTDTS